MFTRMVMLLMLTAVSQARADGVPSSSVDEGRGLPRWSSASTSPGRTQLVELPATVVPGQPPPRPLHALSMGVDAPARWLREAGWGRGECTALLRAPSHLHQGPGHTIDAEVAVRVGLQCHY
ncbi:MAG: hypothetical protein RLZZ598_749 [Pseudomonadota bacterium]|jgi:hypothetical protein